MCNKNLSKEYRERITEKGRGWFSEYLWAVAEDTSDKKELDKKVCRRSVKVFCDMYRQEMADDEDFFNEVEAFCTKRRYSAEKADFFKGVFRRLQASSRDEYIRRYETQKKDEAPE